MTVFKRKRQMKIRNYILDVVNAHQPIRTYQLVNKIQRSWSKYDGEVPRHWEITEVLIMILRCEI